MMEGMKKTQEKQQEEKPSEKHTDPEGQCFDEDIDLDWLKEKIIFSAKHPGDFAKGVSKEFDDIAIVK